LQALFWFFLIFFNSRQIFYNPASPSPADKPIFLKENRDGTGGCGNPKLFDRVPPRLEQRGLARGARAARPWASRSAGGWPNTGNSATIRIV
jgi:hypothetical protein